MQKQSDAAEKRQGQVGRWIEAIQIAGKRQEKWERRADKVVKRYKDERPTETDNSKRFNILWSNVETLKPALFAKLPKPQVSRRYKDNDPVGRQAAMVLERALEYHIDAYDFGDEVRSAVEDYLLPGRAVARVVYEPSYGEEITPRLPVPDGQEMPEGAQQDAQGYFMPGEPYQPVDYEEARCEYVFWKDFRHGHARKWSKVPWVAYRSYLDRDELVKRFGDIGHKVKLDYKPSDLDEEMGKSEEKAEVWEIWDKKSHKVYWVSLSHESDFLDADAPPLDLQGFFPSKKPLYSLKTNDSLKPIPEYCQYQDQAEEIDELTARIALLVKSLKVAGVYAGSDEGVKRLLTEGTDNILIPVDNWAMYAENGGMKGMIDWLPIEQIASVAVSLYEAREKTKQELYEITGLSDIIRGASKANETATAQRIKGQFATLRLSDRQTQVAEFVRDLLRLKAEVICETFSAQTLQLMTGLQVTEEVIAILRNDALRSFRIDIETDSTLMADEQADKEARVEFLEAVTSFMEKLVPMAQMVPPLAPVLGKMLLFGVRGFRAGRELEESIEQALTAMEQQAQQPQQQQLDPQQMEAHAKMVKMQQDMQMDQFRLQKDEQRKDGEFALKVKETQQGMAIDQMRAKAQMQNSGGR
jgi:hypothetical protein